MQSERNFYDPPFVNMIDSGTFWRCPHGHTRWRTWPGCGRCVLLRPRYWFSFVRDRLRQALRALAAGEE